MKNQYNSRNTRYSEIRYHHSKISRSPNGTSDPPRDQEIIRQPTFNNPELFQNNRLSPNSYSQPFQKSYESPFQKTYSQSFQKMYEKQALQVHHKRNYLQNISSENILEPIDFIN